MTLKNEHQTYLTEVIIKIIIAGFNWSGYSSKSSSKCELAPPMFSRESFENSFRASLYVLRWSKSLSKIGFFAYNGLSF